MRDRSVRGAPRPRYDHWWDRDGYHIGDGARVEQAGVNARFGAAPTRLGKRGEVLGRGRKRLYVVFDGESWLVRIYPHLVRVIKGE